jgi:hypothetical protein
MEDFAIFDIAMALLLMTRRSLIREGRRLLTRRSRGMDGKV